MHYLTQLTNFLALACCLVASLGRRDSNAFATILGVTDLFPRSKFPRRELLASSSSASSGAYDFLRLAARGLDMMSTEIQFNTATKILVGTEKVSLLMRSL